MNKKSILFFFLLIFSFSAISVAQEKAKWTNKDKGTYTIWPHFSGVYYDSVRFSLSIKIYELAEGGLQRLEGYVKINNEKYFVYDSTQFMSADGGKDGSNYFTEWFPQGDYIMELCIDKNYYPLKTKKYYLKGRTQYAYTFYVIRKDALKKGREK